VNAAARWSRVSSILSQALDLPETERTAFVAEAIRQEPALRTEVLSLFEDVRHTHGFLEEPAGAPEEAAGGEGSFGPYRVVGKLGEGGMGVVHLAERSDGQFTRRVAIKRVGSVAPSADALRRFRDERQILARLDHPNIARLLDAGVDAANVPYLVMDHVEGVPLTTHCRERKLTVAQRLALFVKICAAVQHAHQNLVIHRDIKPGNILVTTDGDPKLLDFGVAKALGDAPGGDATATVNRALTLDYASPEQVRGAAVTTASDVYSLGIVLYELLADRKPYEVGTKGLSEAVQLICERVPRPPSEVAPAEERSEIAGDLDGIVRKATEKAPADRYASAAELAADVTAHLDHQPVKARRPSFGYVARKFVRRHRTGAAVAAALVVLLLAGVAAVLRQARVAERERARAQQRFEQVRQLANYVIFDLQDGVTKLTGSTELRRQMVERSLAYLDSLAADAAGDGRLQTELAGAYARLGDVLGRQDVQNLGDRQGAVASYGKAEKLLREAISRNPRDKDARRRLGNLLLDLRFVHSSVAPGERERTLKRLEESTAIWEELVREDPQDEESLRGLAFVHNVAYQLQFRSSPETAFPHLERSLDIIQRLLGARPQDPELRREASACHRWMSLALARRDAARAHRHALEAVRIDGDRMAAEPHNADAKLEYSLGLEEIGNVHLAQGRYEEALPFFKQALTLRRGLWEADRTNTLFWNRLLGLLTRIGETHVLAGQHRLAVPFLRETIQHATTRPDQQQHWVVLSVARAYLSLGEVEFAAKRSPCQSYRRMQEQLRDLPNPERFFPPETAGLRERARERLKSCPA
jgi:tetratricopeptide (TPR) repeat protein